MDEQEQKALIEQAQKSSQLDWTKIPEKELSAFAEISVAIGAESTKWAIRTVLMKSFLWYSIVCTAAVLLGLHQGVSPLVLILGSFALAAAISVWCQVGALYHSEKIRTLVKQHDEFMTSLVRKHSGETK